MLISKKSYKLWSLPDFRWLLLGLCMLGLLLPARFSKACGPVFYEFSGYSFLHSDLVEEGLDYLPYYLNFENLYRELPGRDSIQFKSNLQEWSERFCDVYPVAALEQVIYETSIDELKVLRTAANSEKINVPSRLFNNPFARHLKQHKCVETINYLIFAKQCEPHVKKPDPWNPQE